jgi:hypothetical protein
VDEFQRQGTGRRPEGKLQGSVISGTCLFVDRIKTADAVKEAIVR